MKWPRLNGILVRVVLAQIVVIVIVFFALVLMVGQQRGAAAARTIAPLWADAVQRLMNEAPGEPAAPTTRSRLLARPGPPPATATRPMAIRYDALRDELATFGVFVSEIRTSSALGRETTWLQVAGRDTEPRWVGFDGGVFGADENPRRWPLIIFVLILVGLASAATTWTVVRPLAGLQQAIEQFRTHGSWSPSSFGASAGHGPHELRALEESFVAMARERTRLEQDRTLMLAGISHDLRSPLARIRLTADLMASADPALQQAKEAIKRNVDLADRHLATFLDFAAPALTGEAGETGQEVVIDAELLWREAAAGVLPDPSALQLEVDANARSVVSNPRLLARVLAAGLENADKHGTAPIRARTCRRGMATVFEIEDAGPGVPEADRERVMRPFERGEHARTTPGTGLGLALAAQMVERLGGRIELDQKERGLVFRCILPDKPAPV
jgi:two-component system, OmpR family, osmolarity sensor histidine kinase EnvZ